MESDLKPKILECRFKDPDTPELILDFLSKDSKLNFIRVAGAMEEIIGVQYVVASVPGDMLRVILRNDSKTLNQVRNLIEKSMGYRPFPTWEK